MKMIGSDQTMKLHCNGGTNPESLRGPLSVSSNLVILSEALSV
jgi:hypothetical protein